MNTTQLLKPMAEASRNWNHWVAITKTRNWMKRDPLLDWLDLFGAEHGYIKDTEVPSYIAEADFTQFIVRKGNEFEERVVQLIAQRLGLGEIVRVAQEPGDARSVACRDQTLELMRQGTSIIWQGVLWDDSRCVFGVPDLLVRSDLLCTMCDGHMNYKAPNHGAPGLGSPDFHYLVVDIKYRGFDLAANAEAANEAEHYKVQLALYNAALGEAQGFLPPQGFFIGRKWSKGSGKKLEGATNCLDRLIPVSLPLQDQHRSDPVNWLDRAMEAVEWIRRVRREGSEWTAVPPSIIELRPNMKNGQDAPWHNAKKAIAAEIGEPTQIWQVGLDCRNKLVSHGAGDWRDPGIRLDLLANGGGSTEERRRRMIEINRDPNGPLFYPPMVDWARDEWAEPEALEFFVDFETTSNLDDDFSRLPEIGGQPLIFVIGCGHWEPVDATVLEDPHWSLDPAKRRWTFKAFYTEALSESEEKRIIFEWYQYMAEIQFRTPCAPARPKVFHWSPAETRTYSLGSDSAFVRHLQPVGWPEPNWYDFLQSVVKRKGTAHAFYVRGAWGFGLKPLGRALHRHGLIETLWEDGPADGLAAMGGAWACYRIAEERGIGVTEVVFGDRSGENHQLFREVIDYNEVDCRVMAECIQFVRHC